MSRDADGHCLCGAVRFHATDLPGTVSICHCEMCRRWTGSALIEVSVTEANVTWQGADHIATRQSSAWAERAWCRDCGTPLYYRNIEGGAFSGTYDIPLGLFDDPNGFRISHEIYIDHKPDSFAFADAPSRKQLTRADCVAQYPLLASDEKGA